MSPFTSMLPSILGKSWNEGILARNMLRMISFGKHDFNTSWNVIRNSELFWSVFFTYSDWIQRNTWYLFVFCLNAGKYGQISSSVVLTRISCYHFQPDWLIFQANFNLRIPSRLVGVHEYFLRSVSSIFVKKTSIS